MSTLATTVPGLPSLLSRAQEKLVSGGAVRKDESWLDRIGVNVRANEINERTLQLAQHMGFRWLRTDIAWRDVEPQAGAFDFRSLRGAFALAGERGFRILGILDYGHPVYTDMKAPSNAQQRAAFSRYAKRAQDELQEWVTAWEVWNEPNHPRFWPPTPDVEAYAVLLREVATCLWRAQPRTVVVSGGLSTFDRKFLHGIVPTVDELAKSGTIGVGIHPYRWTPPETVVGDLDSSGLLSKQGQAISPGGGAIWFTEWGYCRGNRGVGEMNQASWMSRIPLVGMALNVPLTVLFELRNVGSQDVPAYTCGMVDGSDNPYPVAGRWQGVRAVMRTLRGYDSYVPPRGNGVWLVGSCDAAVAWNPGIDGTLGSAPHLVRPAGPAWESVQRTCP